MAEGMTCFKGERCWQKPCLLPPSRPLPQSALWSHNDGGICLFINTEVTCNQAERAHEAPSASGLLVPHLLVGPARRKGRGRGNVKRQYQEWEFGNTIRGVGKIYISLSFKKKKCEGVSAIFYWKAVNSASSEGRMGEQSDVEIEAA